MCDICSDLLILLDNYEEKCQVGGYQMNKDEVLAFVNYVCVWPQRQCMCCYKSFKNFEKLNNMVQVILSIANGIIQTLPDDFQKENSMDEDKQQEDEKENKDMVDKEKTEESSTKENTKPEVQDEKKKEEGDEDNEEEEKWTMDEKERLLHFVTKVFLMNFPSYMAYKHIVHSSLEELSQQETSALNNYCEISDPEVPLFLLRNVCYFCDSNGIGALKQCFEKATPDSLPFTFAHILISLIANLRLWMNIPTVMQYIVPLRTSVIRYMCKLSDKDLRMAGNRNMTDLMWAAVKEPLETHFTFDKEGLELAFKYFTCSTLTIRLAGIAQINNQINNYNESCNNETLMDAERVGHHLAQWLLDNKIIEHIFGPNLHVEIIKQSQLILNLVAVEGKVTNEHIDCIWAASQLKHCSKQVYDILIPLIKNLELQPVQYLLNLVSGLEPANHTESTLYLASALIKCIWNTIASTHSHTTAIQHHQHAHAHAHVQGQYTALQQEDEEMREADVTSHGKHEMSSGESIQVSDSEESPEKQKKGKKHHRHQLKQVEGNINQHALRSLHKHGVCHHHGEDGESVEECHEHSDGSELEHSGESGHHGRHVHCHEGRVIRGAHAHGESDGSESEVEGSETSEEEEEEIYEGEEGEIIHGQLTEKQRMILAQQRALAQAGHKFRGHLHGRHHHHHHHHGDDSSDEEDEEEEEEDSEYYDSEDEELIKEARLVHLKHGCHESEENSDLEEEARLLHEEKNLPFDMARKILHKHHLAAQQKRALEEAAHIALHRQQQAQVRRHMREHKKEEMKKQEVIKKAEEGKSESDETQEKMEVSGETEEEKETTKESKSKEELPELSQQSQETEIFDCTPYIQQLSRKRKQQIRGENLRGGVMSQEEGEGSCHSSHISNKSEKNMADFEGEDLLSDEELAHINAHAHYNAHQMQQHLSSLESMYHTHMPHVIHHQTHQKEATEHPYPDNVFDDVCNHGNTLLWDLVQEENSKMLPEGLAMEAEKALCTLVCFSTDRKIKMKFIEACVENLAHNRSVVVSLRLLPKIFSSFQQYRSGVDTHHVTMWAEKELNMMSHFFINLVHYNETVQAGNQDNPMYSHKEEIQVRLAFLTCVFSAIGSPDGFRLNLEQVDTLWRCVAMDTECSDECLNWFLNQAKSKDHHAMGLETYKYLFIDKMPLLKAESMSMVGLNLFQQLSHLTRIANASFEEPLTEDQVCGMDQLWSIALRALNTDVSITAIQILNCYYINFGNGQLDKEEEFVQRCMESLVKALDGLEEDSETNLLVIQRGLVLLKNHLEAFRKRYAYHLRNWQIDGKGIQSHQRNVQEKQSTSIRIILQPAGMAEKTQLELSSTDLIAELRAEVARWWENLHKQQLQRHQAEGGHGSTLLSPILGAMLGDGPIRMITLGQELTVDMDEKSLCETQFKDLQLVFVSVGASRPPRKMDGSLPSSCLPSPSHEKLPVILMIREPHFSKLFMLLEKLSKIDFTVLQMESQERWGYQTKARMLSRKVWELLMLLPTNQSMLDGFKSIMSEECSEQTVNWAQLLDSQSPHKLMYSLQIVESLSRINKQRRKSMTRSGGGDSRSVSTDSEMDTQDSSEEIWTQKFITKGGLKHLLNIFKGESLQANGEEAWSQWNQECLAYLLRLISQFSVEQSDAEAGHDDVFESYESPRKKMKRTKGSGEKIVIPRLNQSTLAMLNIESVLKILMQILYDAAVPCDTNPVHAGTWGRAEVVHYSLSFLVSWTYSCEDVRQALCSSPNLVSWMKRLTLEAPEPFVRREACMGLYRLCLGKTIDSRTGYSLLLPMLSSILSFLNDALNIKPHKNNEVDGFKEKEPQGPGCRDYFWLTCRFVESISKEDAKSDTNPVNINTLAKDVSEHILERQYYETRQGYEEDDGLIGLLNLCTSIVKHNPQFKTAPDGGQKILLEVFQCLFALPSPVKRYLPKCKSQASRSSAYDLLVELVKGSVDNFNILHNKMLEQHTKDSHAPYPWDYWPHEDGRSKCGYVGLTNLGATCYMATCMQHLYMIPQARQSVLQSKSTSSGKHKGTLSELQRMFAYLQESERKAYNPRSFCKVYTMDKKPLNTGEQKDMTEFFTDLISKLEEMAPEMQKLVKNQFGGVITNNVVSLDCPHVSRTLEEFYTIRCQVTDMKNLYESLDEVTVKDMLEGDNMYTCSKCQKKVRAEKRACFKKLPRILCFNTMRYTFNMVTMMKEKVNTHFSFPLCLDMSPYMEKNLMGPDKLKNDDDEDDGFLVLDDENGDDDSFEYELIGVTVHTGTADGGHYYSFIRDRIHRSESGQDKWYLFNDAEVKPFDACQIATECFGGEMTSKTYDSVTDKFMDFSFEKTNSAYMLFYERCPPKTEEEQKTHLDVESIQKYNFELSQELAEWIWHDNMQFLQDKNIFEHTYFGFMWQICGYIPTTLSKDPQNQVSLKAAQLSTSFVLETLIHAKEKPTMLQWIELLTKQFNSCPAACEWFLDHMAESDWWPQQILIKCPNQMVRQMFQRLLIHVISQLRPIHMELYLQPIIESDDGEIDVSELGSKSCVTRFVKKMLAILEHGVRPHSKFLTEYFAFLLEFAKMGDEECLFLIHSNAISTMISFYLGQKAQETIVEIPSDDEEDEVITITDDTYKPMSLEKMITLIALLVEKSRGEDNQLSVSEKDYHSIISGKGFPFLYNQIRDNINVRQSCNLIFSLCRWNEQLAVAFVQMVFGAIRKLSIEQSQPFFKLMSMLVEFAGGPPGLPPFTQYVLQRFLELTKSCPQPCLEWMATQVTRNKFAAHWILNQMDTWVETYLLAHSNTRVRNAAAFLLVSLVPSNHFRQTYRTTRSILSPHKEITMSQEAVVILHQTYEHLLGLLSRARIYADAHTQGTTKLISYFSVLTYCLRSKTEKLMFSRYFSDLWNLFQPKLCEPQISMHHNKQALMYFWYQVCVDCPENIKLICSNSHVCKQIAYNYILADHDDQDVVLFNRGMLPYYYGLLRMCCQASRSFTRQLSQHQNVQWAFKNIAPYPTQYPAAVDELFKMMKLMSTKYQDSSDEELRIITVFKRNTMQMFMHCLDARSMWQTLISAFKILIESTDDRLMLISQQGLQMITEAFNTLHAMYHEATACHVTGDIVELLAILLPVLKVARHYHEKKGAMAQEVLADLHGWKERLELVKKLLTLLNSYTPPEIRQISIDVLKEMILTFQSECVHTIVPILTQAHVAFQESNMPMSAGPYFPRRGQKPVGPKSNIRPPRPQFNMMLHSSQIEATKGVDENYDAALLEFFYPYHALIDLLCRVAVNHQTLSESIINLSAMVAIEGVPLHSPYFAKLWYEIYQSEVDRNCIKVLCNSSFFIEYVDSVLLDERQSLNNHNIYQFFCNFFPKVFQQVLSDQGRSLLDSLVASVTAEKSTLENIRSERELLSICHRINGDLRAMMLIFSVQPPKQLNPLLVESLQYILQACREHQQQRADLAQRKRSGSEHSQEEDVDSETSVGTPSKRRRVSSEKEEAVQEKKQNVSQESETDSDEKKGQTDETKSDNDNEDENENGAKSEQSKLDSSHSDSGSKTSDNDGAQSDTKETDSQKQQKENKDTSSTEQESDTGNQSAASKKPLEDDDEQPGPSGQCGQNLQRQNSSESRQSSNDGTPRPRERPTQVDLVARHIESLFSLIEKR